MVKELRTDADIEALAEEAARIILAEQAVKAQLSRKQIINSQASEFEYTGNDPNLQVYYNSQKSVGSLT